MVDPLSLGALGGAALTGGITFLYGQVTELLKRRRDRAEQAAAAPPTVPTGPVEVLDGSLVERPVDLDVVAGNEARLLELRRELTDYADGLTRPDPADGRLLEQVAALRGLLELAYGQHVTFRGEQRPATGSPLEAGASTAVGSYVATVTASGPGAVAVGRDNTGSISTTTYAPAPSPAPGAPPGS
ncbi:hypothetical protein [Geodermatophilus sp. SYSU D01105]